MPRLQTGLIECDTRQATADRLGDMDFFELMHGIERAELYLIASENSPIQ